MENLKSNKINKKLLSCCKKCSRKISLSDIMKIIYLKKLSIKIKLIFKQNKVLLNILIKFMGINLHIN